MKKQAGIPKGADAPNAEVAFARALSIQLGDALVGFEIALQHECDFSRAAERFRRVLAVIQGITAPARISAVVCQNSAN